MQERFELAAFELADANELPAPWHEPRSAAMLCYPGMALPNISAAFHMLAGCNREGHAAYDVALVGPGSGTVRAAGGGVLRVDHHLDEGIPALDALVVPCGFIHSEAFAAPGATRSLVRAVQGARRALMIARTLQQARRAQMLLREASTWAVGSFWEAVRPGHDPLATSYIEDGRLIWAIGPSAACDGVARLIGEYDGGGARRPHDSAATYYP